MQYDPPPCQSCAAPMTVVLTPPGEKQDLAKRRHVCTACKVAIVTYAETPPPEAG